jgi:glycosyltransferase involved in cell wall biosynthesis
MTKTISVVIPTYNEERYIEKCLQSLVNQTLNRDEFEIVVVDGGSADRTVELAESREVNLSRLPMQIYICRKIG